jgi:hypothetical protein
VLEARLDELGQVVEPGLRLGVEDRVPERGWKRGGKDEGESEREREREERMGARMRKGRKSAQFDKLHCLSER